MALKCKEGLDSKFNYYLANTVVSDIKKDARGLIVGIARDAVLRENVFIPSFLEQKKIGVFFSELDNTITLHQRKRDDLKDLKRVFLYRISLKSPSRRRIWQDELL